MNQSINESNFDRYMAKWEANSEGNDLRNSPKKGEIKFEIEELDLRLRNESSPEELGEAQGRLVPEKPKLTLDTAIGHSGNPEVARLSEPERPTPSAGQH